jgi:D-glycero-D-manno-heptose 1,7-bisphosphate phosphatase
MMRFLETTLSELTGYRRGGFQTRPKPASPQVSLKLPSQPPITGNTGILPVLHRLKACASELRAQAHESGKGGAGPPVARASSPWDLNSPKNNPGQRPAVFLDRDGTINEEMGYINHLSRFRLLPNAAPAIRRLNEAGFPVVVITNQSGAARGYFPASLVEEVHHHMQNLLAAQGARVDAIYTCLHAPDEGCSCRKPQPGLLFRAAAELSLDLSRSYLVGDRYVDIQTAANAGVQGILILTGYGLGEYEHFQNANPAQPVHIAQDLLDAAEFIIDREKESDS